MIKKKSPSIETISFSEGKKLQEIKQPAVQAMELMILVYLVDMKRGRIKVDNSLHYRSH